MLPNDSLRNAFSRLTFITGVTFGSQRFDCPFTDEWRTGAIKNILGSAVHQGHPGDVAADEAAPPSNRHSLRTAAQRANTVSLSTTAFCVAHYFPIRLADVVLRRLEESQTTRPELAVSSATWEQLLWTSLACYRLVDVKGDACVENPRLQESQTDRTRQVFEERQSVSQRNRVDNQSVFIDQTKP